MSHPELVLRTGTPDETREVAAAVASLLQPGDVVSLTGELGAGKTCFVQGAARALGITDPVTSPTFTLVRHYDGPLPIVHCDVYRLDRLQDVLDLGDEVLAPDVVTLVEWGDAIAALLPEDRLEVVLELAVDGHGDRHASAPQPDDAAPTAADSSPAADAAAPRENDAGPQAQGDDPAPQTWGDDDADLDPPRRIALRGRGSWETRLAGLPPTCRRFVQDGNEPTRGA